MRNLKKTLVTIIRIALTVGHFEEAVVIVEVGYSTMELVAWLQV